MIVPMPFDLEEKEKTNHHDLNHKTHVANAFSEEIAARVTANIQHLTSTDEKTDGGIRIGPISGNLGRQTSSFSCGVYSHSSLEHAFKKTIVCVVSQNSKNIRKSLHSLLAAIASQRSTNVSDCVFVNNQNGSDVLITCLHTGIENEEKYEYINQLPGFVKIMSGSFIAFPESGDDGRVFVSIASGSRVIADNFPVINDYSVIVDADGFIQNTEYGHIWVDVRGRDHEPTKPNEQEEK